MVKIHERFKDIKKYIKNGTYQSPLLSNENQDQNPVDVTDAEKFYVIKRTGCTSTKATILHGEHEITTSSQSGTKKIKKSAGNNSGEEGSLGSIESPNHDNNKKRKEQAQSRRERAQRREDSIIEAGKSDQDSATKPKRKRRKKANVIMPPELPDGEICDYEKLRFAKMQRNYERMVSLGLCGATAEV